MKIFVRVKTGARQELVEQIDADHFTVSVREQAKENEANKAVEGVLSKYFAIPKTRIHIVKGRSSRNKVVEV